MKNSGLALALAVACVLIGHSAQAREPLTLVERIKAQEAIERVYYGHRLWPKENTSPKPSFEQMVPEQEIRAKVSDALKKSAALEALWYRPITGEQLQAEMDRMVRDSKDPDLLKELFAALGNDPRLIAEGLARPILADRLTRSWYAGDARFHTVARSQAEAALRDAAATDLSAVSEGQHLHVRYSAGEDSDPQAMVSETQATGMVSVPVSSQELERLKRDMPPEGRLSGVVDTGEAFAIYRTLKSENESLEVEGRIIPKRSFNLWWDEERRDLPQGTSAPDFDYQLPTPGRTEAAPATCLGTWDPVRLHSPPVERCGHTAVWTGTEMIGWGGQLNSGGRYSPATGAWMPTSTGDGCPTARYQNSAIWTGTEMIIWGGNGTQLFSTGGRYNPVTDSWVPTRITDACPTPRGAHTAVWTGSYMVVWGGAGNPSDPDGQFKNSGAKYNPLDDSWVSISTGANCPEGRYVHTAVWTGSQMVVWGGVTPAGGSNTGGRYDLALNTWLSTSTGAQCPERRFWHGAVWTGTEMIVWGGLSGDSAYTSTGGRYKPSTDTWTATPTGGDCPSPRVDFSLVWTGTQVIIWGGRSPNSDFYNSGSLFDPGSSTWAPTSQNGACPSGRYGHTAVWTGGEMIVWGGYPDQGTYGSGGRYSPSSDSWVPTNATEAIPAPRFYHQSVWTGTEMVVWAGRTLDAGVSNTGGAYSPSTDSWNPTSTGTDCPSGRWLFTAVWTGTEMVVWGGEDYADQMLNTGGRYNPTSDTWAATSLGPNCPSPRAEHSAVWTGTDMIIWGGRDSTTSFNTGGRYNPLANGWVPTSTAGLCPSPRVDHSAIWTGTEMIVWGANGAANTGGRYNPVSDSWSATSTGAGCPTPRTWHAAIWTGSRMIVWGGLGAPGDPDGQIKNTGGQYDPTTNSWTPTSTASPCPYGRFLAYALWTGDEMIIWGGNGTLGGGYTEDRAGGRYDPLTNSWRPTQQGTNCPTNRAIGSAVWTGTSMIVWGGTNNNGWPGDGGVYTVTGPPLGSPSSLAAPSAVDASPCATGINLSWPQDAGDWKDGGTGEYRTYQVYRNSSPIASGGCAGSWPYGTTTCSDTTTSANASYTYQVQYVNACGLGTLSMAVSRTDQVLGAPGAVSNPSPLSGGTNVSLTPTLSWTAASGATSYDLYLGKVSSPPFMAATGTPSYAPPALDVDTVYYWRIVPKNICAAGPSSPTWTFRTACPPPVAAGTPSPADAASGVLTASSLTWSAVTGATSYDVYLGTSASPVFASNVTGTSYAPPSLTPSTTYYWKVVPKNQCGSAANCPVWSFRICDLPAVASTPAPSNGTVGVLTTSALSWTAVATAESYDVYFGTGATPPLVGNVSGTGYVPGTMAPSTTYYWKVVPKNPCGSAPDCPTWSFRTCDLPAAASSPSPTDGATGVLTGAVLSWAAVATADSYDVYFGTAATPPYAGTVPGTSYPPPALAPSTTYYWKVVPKSDCGDAIACPVWSFRTCDLPAAASSPAPADGATSILLSATLTWSVVSSADSYDVYFGTSSSPALAGNVPGTTYVPSALSPSTTYFWKVVPHSPCGSASSCPLWSFRTCDPPPAASAPSPADGVTGALTGATLSWSAASGAVSYDVYFGTSSSPPPAGNVSGTAYVPGALSPSTTYFWKVVPRSACGTAENCPTWSFRTCDLPSPASGPSPSSGSAGVLTTATMGWAGVAGADSYEVYFGISSNPPLVAQVAMPGYAPGSLAPGTTYYWKVVPRSVCGNGEQCPTWSFSTCTLPAAALSPAPGDGTTAVPMRPVLTWSPASGAEAYDVYFGTEAQPQFAATVQSASYTPGPLGGNTMYYWRVVPKNNCGSAVGAAVWRFTTVVPPAISIIGKLADPFGLKVSGSNFYSGAVVKINGQPIPQTVYKSSVKLLAKGGATLKAMLPKGTSVCVTVENPDGGFSQCYPFTR